MPSSRAASASGSALRSCRSSLAGARSGTAAHMLTDKDQQVRQEPDLLRELVSVMAGAAGEKLEFGCLSTGVHDDLHAATALARAMVTAFGMSDELGPVTIGEKQGEVFLGNSLQDLGQIGPDTLNLIDREVERLVGESLAHAATVLQANWHAVVELADALLEHETLSGVALDALLSTVHPMPVAGDEQPPASELARHGCAAPGPLSRGCAAAWRH